MTGEGNATWLILGKVPTLIDAGTGEPKHLEALEAALDGTRLAQVLVTHGHVDHASGAPHIAERMPHVRFLKMPWPERDSRWPVGWQPLADGDVVSVGDTSLRAVHTPGHAPDHLCFWHEGDQLLFSGDLVWQGSTVVVPPSHGGNLSEYLASLNRVLGLAPLKMLPAHGPVIDNPSALIREYIEHRATRERQVLGVVLAGAVDPAAIVSAIYPTLAGPLLPVAAETILAHLLKLELEGKVRRVGDRWEIHPATNAKRTV